MSTLRFFRTFLAVARAGSFSEAAEQVALTQAAVSFQMKSLESELGQVLFARSGRVAVLNAAGLALVPEVRKLLEQYDRLRLCQQPPGELAGLVSFGAIVSCMGTLARVVSQLKQQHAALDVRVVSGKATDLTDKVQAGELDAAFVVEPGRRLGALSWTALYQEPLVVVAPAPLGVRRARDALARYPFLRFDRSEHTGRLLERTLHRLQWPVNEFLELNSIDTLVELVRQEAGVTLLPLVQGASWEADAALTVLPLPVAQQAARVIGMVERAGHARQHITATICGRCLEQFRGD